MCPWHPPHCIRSSRGKGTSNFGGASTACRWEEAQRTVLNSTVLAGLVPQSKAQRRRGRVGVSFLLELKHLGICKQLGKL